MKKYNPKQIESKWQKFWEKNNLYKAKDSGKSKYYFLVEFPYPSGDGLHVGHVRSYAALDALARKKRMQGFNVLYPMGWDAFGLPAENYAIKTGIHPSITVKKNIATFKKQMKNLGLSFDWSREINTTDPKYYKWTQWIFLQLYKKGLAYKKKMTINWCPKDKIGLANEEVVDGKCERCGTSVEKKEKEQWMMAITKYADRLIEDLDTVNYLEKIKTQQINWIGKSFGAELDFKLEKGEKKITVFTTRIDTVFGVTAVALAPENPLVKEIVTGDNKAKVEEYIKASNAKSEFERTKLEKEKTGIFTGSYCINPLNNERVPIWVGDYVIASYGGGSVMMVPAHDERDFQFAKKFNIPIKEVVSAPAYTKASAGKSSIEKQAFTDYGVLVNSGEFNGLTSEQAIEKIIQWLEERGFGKKTIQYKLRDWVFSRQHYWGEPIPIIYCRKCWEIFKSQIPNSNLKEGVDYIFIDGKEYSMVSVPEKDLPVELPFVKKYEPTGTGESPLSTIEKWVNVKCPVCKSPAKRETDTMPNWAGSSWYFMRYIDPHNNKELASKKKLDYWMTACPAVNSEGSQRKICGGVDWYNGGMEHTTLHLLYSRFWYKFLYDIKVAPQPEPYAKRTSHGIVLAHDGRKMSKSWGNVINPDSVVKEYGADTLRVYEMFMGPFDQMIAWDDNGIVGCRRFLDRVWNLVSQEKRAVKSGVEVQAALHKLIKKVTEDLDNAKFNTAIAAFMEFTNFLSTRQDVGKDAIKTMLVLFAPFAPHIAEELWSALGNKKSAHLQKWPQFDEKLMKEELATIIIQVNGKVRGKIESKADISEEEVKEKALSQDRIKELISGKEVKKIIYIKGRLINIVI